MGIAMREKQKYQTSNNIDIKKPNSFSRLNFKHFSSFLFVFVNLRIRADLLVILIVNFFESFSIPIPKFYHSWDTYKP